MCCWCCCFREHFGPWLMSTLVKMAWSQALVHFTKNVLDLSNLILITEAEQRDISIWFWWMWSACTLKEKLSGKDWKFLLRKSKSNTVFQYLILICYKWPWRLYSTGSTSSLDYSIMALRFIFRVYLGFVLGFFFLYTCFLFCPIYKENILLEKSDALILEIRWISSLCHGENTCCKIWMISTISYWTDRKISCPSTIWQEIDQVTLVDYTFLGNKKVCFLLLCIQIYLAQGVAHCRSLNQIK